MQTELKVSYEGPRLPPSPPATRAASGETGEAPQPATVSRQETRPNQEAAQTKEYIDRAMKRMNDYVQSVNRNLNFSVDETSGRNIIKVIDAETEEVIRQIPPEEMLALARRLVDSDAGTRGPVLIEAKT